MSSGEEKRYRVAVLGGGISGLTAAYTLARARLSGAPVEEFLIEGRDRLGGVIRTERVEGFTIEAGPDSFLTEKPEASALCRELGLGDSLAGSNDGERRTYILYRGRLEPLPDGLLLLVPTRLWPVLKSRLLSLETKIKLATEWFKSPHNSNSDVSVADFVRRHFGSAMHENIAEPLLAGVYGGDSNVLSARSVLPRFWRMEKEFGSLTRAVLKARKDLQKARRGSPPGLALTPPLFTTVKGGLQQIIEKLKARLNAERLHLRHRVAGLEVAASGPGQYRICCGGGKTFDADAVILAMPTHETSRLLAGLDNALAGTLAGIPYTSAMTVAMGYGPGQMLQLPYGFGFLVPQKENRKLLACTFLHRKFPYTTPAGSALLRCFLGGSRDPEVLNLMDGEIVALVRRELHEILGLDAEPLFYRINRWPASMAQYLVGHEERMIEIKTRLENHPRLFLAGNGFSGIGISDCVRTGRTAAEAALRVIRS